MGCRGGNRWKIYRIHSFQDKFLLLVSHIYKYYKRYIFPSRYLAVVPMVIEKLLLKVITPQYRVFSRDVTAAMLVSLNKGTAAMLVSQSNPPGIELYSYANVFFCFGRKTCSLIT